MTYNMIYLEGKTGRSMAKRFSVTGVTRDRDYDLTKGAKGSRCLYLTANPNGESEVVTVQSGTENEEVVLHLAPAGKLIVSGLESKESASIGLMQGETRVARFTASSRTSTFWIPPGTYGVALKSKNPSLKLSVETLSISAGEVVELTVTR